MYLREAVAENFNPRSPYGERPTATGCVRASSKNFNPRSPYGERRNAVGVAGFNRLISIHAPRMGSDPYRFYKLPGIRISIHAPRMGSDFHSPMYQAQSLHFNPRSPYGERLTATFSICQMIFYFNPRSPYGERLRAVSPVSPGGNNFNPRSPYGERLFLPICL